MSHLDEGQLAALLDGELNEAERKAAEAHLAACGACRARYEEEQMFAAEADRLVTKVEPPRAVTAPTTGHPLPTPRRMPSWRTLAWAATLVLAAGLGYLGRNRPFAPARETDQRVRQESLSQVNAPAPTLAAEPAPRAALPAAPRPAADAPTAGVAAGRANEVATDAVAPKTAAEEVPAPPTDAAAMAPGAVATAERVSQRDVEMRVESPPSPAAKMLGGVGATGTFGATTMEESVRLLGGSIRLIDGLQPIRLLRGAAGSAPGADPSTNVVRVVYLDPPGRELWLDQQRLPTADEDQSVALQGDLMVGDTLLAPVADGRRSLRWRDRDGFRLILTGFLPADSLYAFARRVR